MSKNRKFDEPLAVMVACGQTIRAAAAELKCSESHAYNISQTMEFKARVAVVRSEFTSAAVGKLADCATLAVDTLRELLGPGNEPSIRLNASKAILNAMPSVSEFGELRQRLDKLESNSQLRIAK